MKNIPLTQGKFAIVDDEDYEVLKNIKWSAAFYKCTWYALGYINRKQHLMHRFIIKPSAGFVVDHINGDGLDNRKSNIRVCTQKQNRFNAKPKAKRKTGFKCVYTANGKFYSRMRINGVRKTLGMFPTPELAAKAYDEAAEKYYGEFARTNKSLGLLN